MIRPLPLFRRWGMARRENRTVLNKVSSKAECQADSSNDSNFPNGGPPALLTRISRRPNLLTAAAMILSASCGLQHIDWYGEHLAFADGADLSCGGVEGIGVAGSDDYIRAFRGQGGGTSFSEALTGGEYKCGFAGELQIHGD